MWRNIEALIPYARNAWTRVPLGEGVGWHAQLLLHRRDPLLGRVAYRELGLGGFLLLGCLNAREGVCGLASDFGLLGEPGGDKLPCPP